MYFFTPRRPTSTRSRRASRTAGCGFWNGCGRDIHIKDGSRVIGHKSQFNFVSLEGEEKEKTDWIMHEFRLQSPSSTVKFDDMVLCRIYLKKKCSETEERVAAMKLGEEQSLMAHHDGTRSYMLINAGSSGHSSMLYDVSGIPAAVVEQEETEAEEEPVKKRSRVVEHDLVADYGETSFQPLPSSSSLLSSLSDSPDLPDITFDVDNLSDLEELSSFPDLPNLPEISLDVDYLSNLEGLEFDCTLDEFFC